MPRIIAGIFWAVLVMACATNPNATDGDGDDYEAASLEEELETIAVERPEPAAPPDLDSSAPQWVRDTVLRIWQESSRHYAFQGLAGWGTCTIPEQDDPCYWVAYISSGYYQFRLSPDSIEEFGVDGNSLDEAVSAANDSYLEAKLEVKEHLR